MHPLRIGLLYGLIAAVIQVATVQINHTVLNANGIVGFLGAFLAPAVTLYLAGHLAGRRERMQLSGSTSGLRSTLHGTQAGLWSGVAFIIFLALAGYLKQYLPYNPQNDTGAVGAVLAGLGFIGALIGWFFMGIVLGTIGGALGDNLAARQLKGQTAVK